MMEKHWKLSHTLVLLQNLLFGWEVTQLKEVFWPSLALYINPLMSQPLYNVIYQETYDRTRARDGYNFLAISSLEIVAGGAVMCHKRMRE